MTATVEATVDPHIDEVWDGWQNPPFYDQLLTSGQRCIGNLRYWAEEGTDEVLDSVDAQASWLHDGYLEDDEHDDFHRQRPHPDYVYWPSDAVTTTGPGKDYLGAVMRYARKRRQAQVEGPVDIQRLDAPPPTLAVVAEKDAEIERLTERVAQQERELAAARNHHQHDINLIGQTLMAEADSRSWCSEYDQIIDNLNASLFRLLPTREKEYQVTWVERHIVEVRCSTTVTARDEEEAEQYVQNNYAGEYAPSVTTTGPYQDLISEVEYDESSDFETEEID